MCVASSRHAPGTPMTNTPLHTAPAPCAGVCTSLPLPLPQPAVDGTRQEVCPVTPVSMPTCALGSLTPALLQPLPALLLGLPAGLPQSALRLSGPLLDLPLKLGGQSNGAASSDVLLLCILHRQVDCS